MASQGPRLATVASDVADGDAAWTSTGKVLIQDDDGAAISLVAGQKSDSLVVTAFGFTIPAGSTIDGLEVTVRKKATLLKVNDRTFQMVVSGTAGGDNFADVGVDWGGAFADQVYGGATELFSLALTSALVNAVDFGVKLKVEDGGAGACSGLVDVVTVKVYYALPPAAGVQRSKRWRRFFDLRLRE